MDSKEIEEQSKFEVSNFVELWLKEDSRPWKPLKNPNCFTDNTLRALYVYEGHIKYWEDIRCPNISVNIPFPTVLSALKDSIFAVLKTQL